MCYDHPLRLHYPSGLELIRKQRLDKVSPFQVQLSMDLNDEVQYSMNVHMNPITGMYQESTSNSADV